MVADGKKFFVQEGRVILHMYDTKAAEKQLKFRDVTTAGVPCFFCRTMYSGRSSELGKVIYEGSRHLLPLEHFLRSKGQSQQNVPDGYYVGSKESYLPLRTELQNPLKLDEIIPSRSVVEGPFSTYSLIVDNLELTSLQPSEQISLRKFLKDSNSVFTWFHTSLPLTLFSSALYYHHLDYRSFYPFSRTSNDTYLDNGMTALMNKIEDINGVYGIWPYAKLFYSDVATQTSWDPFHVLKGILKCIIELLTDVRKISTSGIQFCFETKSHPDLYVRHPKKQAKTSSNNKGSSKPKKDDSYTIPPPWALLTATITAIDIAITLILLPVGYYTPEYKFIKPFSNSKQLFGIPLINLFKNLAYYIIMIIKKNQESFCSAYLGLLALLAEDLRDLLSPMPFTKETIDELYFRVVELVSLNSGLFPASESRMIWHELICIVKFIEYFGPLRGWWSVHVERAIAYLKKYHTTGGQSFHLPLLKRYIFADLEKMREFYQPNTTATRSSRLSKDVLDNSYTRVETLHDEIFGDKQMVTHSERMIRLSRQNRNDAILLTSVEFHSLLLVLINEISKITAGNIKKAIQKSRLCRLWFAYLVQRKNNYKFAKMKFFGEYLNEIHLKFQSGHHHEFAHLMQSEIPTEIADKDEVYTNIFVNGNIYEPDLYFLPDYISNLNKIKTSIYSKASIFGKSFSSRGFSCCERELPQQVLEGGKWNSDRTFKVLKSENSLIRNAFTKSHFSSWCEVTFPTYNFIPDFESRLVGTSAAVQFNYFFRITFKEEPLLDGTPIASVTARTIDCYRLQLDQHHRLMTDMIRVDTSKDRQSLMLTRSHLPVLFVALTDCKANPFGVVPLDVNDCPLSINDAGNPETEKKINSLLLIGLSPEDKKISYDPTYTFLYNDKDLDYKISPNNNATTQRNVPTEDNTCTDGEDAAEEDVEDYLSDSGSILIGDE